MKEWIDIVREASYFNLMVTSTRHTVVDLDVFELQLPTVTHGITLEFETVYAIDQTRLPLDFVGRPPNYMAYSSPQSFATEDSHLTEIKPHADGLAAAQKANNIMFVWGRNEREELKPYREDGLPAIVLAVNLRKHYRDGQLHRKGVHPAIVADHVAALWYREPGVIGRNNGPEVISLEGYKEFWLDGEYKGNRWMHHHQSWSPRARGKKELFERFMGSLRGTTNMLGTTFFNDVEDEVCYIADFG